MIDLDELHTLIIAIDAPDETDFIQTLGKTAAIGAWVAVFMVLAARHPVHDRLASHQWTRLRTSPLWVLGWVIGLLAVACLGWMWTLFVGLPLLWHMMKGVSDDCDNDTRVNQDNTTIADDDMHLTDRGPYPLGHRPVILVTKATQTDEDLLIYLCDAPEAIASDTPTADPESGKGGLGSLLSYHSTCLPMSHCPMRGSGSSLNPLKPSSESLGFDSCNRWPSDSADDPPGCRQVASGRDCIRL